MCDVMQRVRAFGGRAPRSSFSKYKFPQGEIFFKLVCIHFHTCVLRLCKNSKANTFTRGVQKKDKNVFLEWANIFCCWAGFLFFCTAYKSQQIQKKFLHVRAEIY